MRRVCGTVQSQERSMWCQTCTPLSPGSSGQRIALAAEDEDGLLDQRELRLRTVSECGPCGLEHAGRARDEVVAGDDAPERRWLADDVDAHRAELSQHGSVARVDGGPDQDERA